VSDHAGNALPVVIGTDIRSSVEIVRGMVVSEETDQGELTCIASCNRMSDIARMRERVKQCESSGPPAV
jgi:hypothetical protein